MTNHQDIRTALLLKSVSEEEIEEFSNLQAPFEQDCFLYRLVNNYIQSSKFNLAVKIGNTIENTELKENIFEIIFATYIRNIRYFKNTSINTNLIAKINDNIKNLNQNILSNVNQRIKTINFALDGDTAEVIQIIEQICQTDLSLTVSSVIDLFSLGLPGYTILLEIMRNNQNNDLQQIIYHLFRENAGYETRQKLKKYKPKITILLFNEQESYKFQKFNENEIIIYKRIKEWEDYQTPNFINSWDNSFNLETIRQIFLPCSFILFTEPNLSLIAEIKKDIYLRRIPVIYPQSNDNEAVLDKILQDSLIKLYKPSESSICKFSGQEIEKMVKNHVSESIIAEKIKEMDENVTIFIQNILDQI